MASRCCCRRGRARRRRSRSGGSAPAAPEAVVDPASRERCVVERVDRRTVGADEGHVRAGAGGLALGDPEDRLLVRAEAGRLPFVERHHDPVAERRERLLEEGPARRVVPNVEADMVDHCRPIVFEAAGAGAPTSCPPAQVFASMLRFGSTIPSRPVTPPAATRIPQMRTTWWTPSRRRRYGRTCCRELAHDRDADAGDADQTGNAATALLIADAMPASLIRTREDGRGERRDRDRQADANSGGRQQSTS